MKYTVAVLALLGLANGASSLRTLPVEDLKDKSMEEMDMAPKVEEAGSDEMMPEEGLIEEEIEMKKIKIGDREYELFFGTDRNGKMYCYLKLAYGPEDALIGGFLADEFGNLIDMEGNVLTSLEDMEEFLEDGFFDEHDEGEG